MFDDKSVMITGGTGSFGKHFIKRISKKFKPKVGGLRLKDF